MQIDLDDAEDPHEVLHVYEGDGGVIIRDGGNVSTFGEQSPEVLAAFNAASALVPAGVAELVERLNGENPDRVTATDRLRLFAHDPDTFAFDQDDALSLIPTIEEAASLITSLSADNARMVERIAELEAGAKEVETWWLEQGMAMAANAGEVGAPYAIFRTRALLNKEGGR